MEFITIGDIYLKKSLIDSIEYKPTPDGEYKFSIEIKTSKKTYFAHFNTEADAKKEFEKAKKELGNNKNYPDSIKMG